LANHSRGGLDSSTHCYDYYDYYDYHDYHDYHDYLQAL
jgi:hypothetical protein